MLRHLPGLLAALAAFIAVKLVSLVASIGVQFLAFLAVYVAVAFSIDAAFSRYGQKQKRR